MKKLCTKRIYLFLYSIVLFPNIYFTISQGTPHYPVKGKNDYPMSVVEEKSYAYYRRALESGEHIAYLVYDNGKFIGAGGVSFYQVMPTYHNPTGKKAYIMNMYTAPEYRRQGIAIHTLDLLVKDAKEQGVLQIALEATDMGRPLYERYGFVKMEDEMELI